MRQGATPFQHTSRHCRPSSRKRQKIYGKAPGQQTQAGRLVHDLLVVANLKRTLVREKEPPGELMVVLAPAELELHAPPKLDVVDIRHPVVEAGDVYARLPGLRTTGNVPSAIRNNLKRT
jgi:hypothetical protein